MAQSEAPVQTGECSILKCDTKSREPICQPLMTLEEVAAWQPGHDDLCVARIPKISRRIVEGPKTLVCHDMKGGYLDDRFVQGVGNSQFYRFYHWQYVDTFVYFSHYFVTVPPPAWTNAAHKHGTLMLGTLITEWNDGKKNCETFLKSEASYKAFAEKLLQVAQYYGFDGWLVNIENVIETPELVGHLRDFVSYLTQRHHEKIPGSQVIWYDSVTDTGQLDWQNKLNSSNQMFFDVSDGIFLNYCWTDTDLQLSQTNAKQAGRPYDVYVGIDVFGRGCKGGGGYNTSEALEVVRNYSLSAAIFGQGWTHEVLGAENFTLNENRFWQMIDHVCPVRSIISLPLVTSFCQGYGDRYFVRGQLISSQPWYNQNLMQVQPTFTQAQFADIDQSVSPLQLIDICTEEAYLGGSSLCLVADLRQSNYLEFKLFDLDVDLQMYHSLIISYTFKPLQDHDCDVYLTLELEFDNQTTTLVLGSTQLEEKPVPMRRESSNKCSVKPSTLLTPVSKKEAELYLHVDNTGHAADNTGTGWLTRYFMLPSLYMKCVLKLLSVGLYTSSSRIDQEFTDVLVGQILLWPGDTKKPGLPLVSFSSLQVDLQAPAWQEGSTDNKPNDAGLSGDDGNSKQDSREQEAEKSQTEQEETKEQEKKAANVSASRFNQKQLQNYRQRRRKYGRSPGKRKQPTEHLTSYSCYKNSFTIHWTTSNKELIHYYNVYAINKTGTPVLLGHSIHTSFKVCRNGLVQMSAANEMESERVVGGDKVSDTGLVVVTSEQKGDEKIKADGKTDADVKQSTFLVHILIQPVLTSGAVVSLQKCSKFDIALSSVESVQ